MADGVRVILRPARDFVEGAQELAGRDGLHADHLDALCAAQGFGTAPYTSGMALTAGGSDTAHPDPFPRMIAAIATEVSYLLMSIDVAFDTISALMRWPGRFWA